MPQKVPADSLRKYGMSKLLGQLTVLECRIRTGFSIAVKRRWDSPDEETWIVESLVLDVETYYTVAHDCLKLAEVLLGPEGVGLKTEPTYRRICAIRSHMVRHAFDKNDGDPSPSLGWTPTSGPQLKCGSTVTGFQDPGFFENQRTFVALLEKYRLGRFVSPGGYQRIADYLRRVTGDAGLDGYALPQIHYSDELRIGTAGLAFRLLPVVVVEKYSDDGDNLAVLRRR
jgi:hypothetical protein